MGLELGSTGKQQRAVVRYVNDQVPYIVEENLGDSFLGHDDFAFAEVLQDQEIVYQSLGRNAESGSPRVTPIADSRSNHDHGQSSEERSSSSRAVDPQLQLAIDEALARELQDFEFGDTNRTAPAVTPTSNTVPPSANAPPQITRQDDIDPDNMTYEELQQLGEAIGTESKGLSDELISLLPCSTYKSAMFSRKEKHECVICCMAYKYRDKLITLPCQHQYHKPCVTKWLKINKACPICNEEVFGS